MDIIALREYAEQIEIELVSLDSLVDVVGEGHKYWLDTEGKMFGPAVILTDWEAAQVNPLWVEHIESIRHTNLENPIWIAPDGSVFDGMHRLTQAFLIGAKQIKVRKFKEIPQSAIISQ